MVLRRVHLEESSAIQLRALCECRIANLSGYPVSVIRAHVLAVDPSLFYPVSSLLVPDSSLFGTGTLTLLLIAHSFRRKIDSARRIRPVMNPRVLATLFAFAFFSVGRADLITMNVDPNGTTSNSTLYGTVVSGLSATWPSFTADKSASQYRDYQFELLTASGSTTFDSFAVQLSAQLRQNTPSGNLLRATLWSGPIVPNPQLSSALVTISTPNSAMTSSGYSSVLLSGSSFEPQVISTTPSTFFFRVWAEGAGQNNGYQTKMAASLGEMQSVTMAPAPAIDGFIEYDTNNDGVIDSTEQSSTRDLISEVPEPSAYAMALAGLACGGFSMWRRRKRA